MKVENEKLKPPALQISKERFQIKKSTNVMEFSIWWRVMAIPSRNYFFCMPSESSRNALRKFSYKGGEVRAILLSLSLPPRGKLPSLILLFLIGNLRF